LASTPKVCQNGELRDSTGNPVEFVPSKPARKNLTTLSQGEQGSKVMAELGAFLDNRQAKQYDALVEQIRAEEKALAKRAVLAEEKELAEQAALAQKKALAEQAALAEYNAIEALTAAGLTVLDDTETAAFDEELLLAMRTVAAEEKKVEVNFISRFKIANVDIQKEIAAFNNWVMKMRALREPVDPNFFDMFHAPMSTETPPTSETSDQPRDIMTIILPEEAQVFSSDPYESSPCETHVAPRSAQADSDSENNQKQNQTTVTRAQLAVSEVFVIHAAEPEVSKEDPVIAQAMAEATNIWGPLRLSNEWRHLDCPDLRETEFEPSDPMLAFCNCNPITQRACAYCEPKGYENKRWRPDLVNPEDIIVSEDIQNNDAEETDSSEESQDSDDEEDDDVHFILEMDSPAKKKCTTVNTPEGCRYGKACWFSHSDEGVQCETDKIHKICDSISCAKLHKNPQNLNIPPGETRESFRIGPPLKKRKVDGQMIDLEEVLEAYKEGTTWRTSHHFPAQLLSTIDEPYQSSGTGMKRSRTQFEAGQHLMTHKICRWGDECRGRGFGCHYQHPSDGHPDEAAQRTDLRSQKKCHHGKDCWYKKQGKCLYDHEEDESSDKQMPITTPLVGAISKPKSNGPTAPRGQSKRAVPLSTPIPNSPILTTPLAIPKHLERVPLAKPTSTPDQMFTSFPPNAPKGLPAYAPMSSSCLSGPGFINASFPNTPTPVGQNQQLPFAVPSVQMQNTAPPNAPKGPRNQTIQQRSRRNAFGEPVKSASSSGSIESRISRDVSHEPGYTASSGGSIQSQISRTASKEPPSTTSSDGSIQSRITRDTSEDSANTASSGGSIQSRITRNAYKRPVSTASSDSSIRSRIQRDDARHPQQSHGQQPRNGSRNRGGHRRRKGRKD
jgi:hypothetical protein